MKAALGVRGELRFEFNHHRTTLSGHYHGGFSTASGQCVKTLTSPSLLCTIHVRLHMSTQRLCLVYIVVATCREIACV